MSIFDFFKKKRLPEISRTITFGELTSLVDDESKELEKKSELFKKEIQSNTMNFSSRINGKLPPLKSINLQNRKETEELKKIVLQNLTLYVGYLERMVEELRGIKSNEAEGYIEEIQNIFNSFSKNTKMNYERATILIGKELGEIKELTNNFAKSFNQKIEYNKDIFDRIKLVEDIKASLNELANAEKIQHQLENSIGVIQTKIIRIKKEKAQAENDSDSYKRSFEYRDFLALQEKINQENKTTNEEILKLKQELDLKKLLRYFHTDEKKSRIIRNYFDNFIESLKADDSLEIISLVKKINPEFNEENIREIKYKILSQTNLVENENLKEIESRLKKIEQDIINQQKEIEEEKKKIVRFGEKQKNLLGEIGEKAKILWPNDKIDI